ncbi:unnamed protein product, partial [Mesorhabditis belari]|uniref:Elongation of very long chain fatty acids protein n=1 Tax=Mesorhabditis belari TaxID=2138241 RepID=A0AAF3F3G3_9BILA
MLGMFAMLSRPPSTFRFSESVEFMENARPAGFIITLLYVITIFSIRYFLRNRKPFQLTTPLALWNLGLGIFSGVGFCVVGHETLVDIYHNGFDSAFCNPLETNILNGWSGWYQVLFVWSKVIELGDTIFIVLRKRPLIFLHWYHHIFTLNYCIWSYETMKGVHLYIGLINFAIHSFMYSYFFCRAAQFHVPSWFAKCLTMAQITQFFLSISAQFYAYYLYLKWDCKQATHFPTFYICLFMELSFVGLFSRFFYLSYISSLKKEKHH